MSSKIAGLGEIEGSKRLVALAQKWKRSADAKLSVAQKELVARQEPNAGSSTVEFAKAQVLAAIDGVKTAEAYLAQVEQRWEVIDVDDKDGGAPSTLGAPQTQKTRDEDQPDAASAANIVAASSSSDCSQNNADSDDDVIVLDDSGDESPNGTGATAPEPAAAG
ncbi:hypothetical protein ACHAXT_012646 [Thalassiosira profunda]